MTTSGQADRIVFPVLTASGPEVEIEIRIGQETVEVWQKDLRMTIFDRCHLRSWFSNPTSSIGMGEVRFALDRFVDIDGRIAISMPDVDAWTLDHDTARKLRNRL